MMQVYKFSEGVDQHNDVKWYVVIGVEGMLRCFNKKRLLTQQLTYNNNKQQTTINTSNN